MANNKSSIKRMHQNEKRRLHNRIWRTRTRTFVKKARATIEDGEQKAALEATIVAVRELDKAASKGIIHKRNAARRKSRLMKRLAALQA